MYARAAGSQSQSQSHNFLQTRAQMKVMFIERDGALAVELKVNLCIKIIYDYRSYNSYLRY